MKTKMHPHDYNPRRNVVHDRKYQTAICLTCGGPTVIFEYNHPAYCPKCGSVPLIRVPETFVADVRRQITEPATVREMENLVYMDGMEDYNDLKRTQEDARN